jgi:hypothetical protein
MSNRHEKASSRKKQGSKSSPLIRRFVRLIRGERQKGEEPRPLYRPRQLALVFCAGTCDPPGYDLSSVGNISAQLFRFFVINPRDLVHAVMTYFWTAFAPFSELIVH